MNVQPTGNTRDINAEKTQSDAIPDAIHPRIWITLVPGFQT